MIKERKKRVFTKIRKWAKENGFKVENCQYMSSAIDIEINGKRYMIDDCDSTSYKDWRGNWGGYPKHIAIHGSHVGGYHAVYSQREVIEVLEKKVKERDANEQTK